MIHLIWLCFFVFITLIPLSISSQVSLGASLQTKPPSFTSSSLSGNQVKLSDHTGDAVLFINFWSSWSSPCLSQNAIINTLSSHFQSNQGVKILSINVGESNKTIQKYMMKHKFEFDPLMDEMREISTTFEILSLPTTLVVDLSGKIVDIRNGIAQKDFFLKHPTLKHLTMPFAQTSSIYEKPQIKIYFNQSPLQLNQNPIIRNGRTLLPLRDLATALGFQNDDDHIIWDPVQRSVTLHHNSLSILLSIGSQDSFLNNDLHILDVAPIIYQERTYIPVRFVSEALNKKVTWNGPSQVISITDQSTDIPSF